MTKNLLLALIFFVNFSILFGQVDHFETVVYEDDSWNYLVPSATVPATWITLGYNDSGWSTGPGGFGMGDGDDNTAVAGGTISIYQRIIFNITDVSAIEKVIFNLDYDDAFVAYINGIEICRSEINSVDQPAFDQTADALHEAELYQGGYPFQKQLDLAYVIDNLTNGINVLAIQTHNISASSSDLSSRAWLSFGINNTSTDYGPTPSWFIPPVDLQSSNLPIIVINTNAVNIPDEPKIDGTMGIIYNGLGALNYVTDSYNEFYGEIGIETRGSSSGGFPMKSYGLETRGPSPEINYNASIFDWPSDNDWILYAPYNDKSLIRNVLTYKIGNEMGNYSPRTQMCEVILNGEYLGVYVFMERIKQNPGRVDIDELEYNDISGNELTGGYILKVDKTTAGGIIAWTSPYTCAAPGTGPIEFQLHDPEIDTLNPIQLVYIQDYITNWENALAGSNFTDPVLGYAPYIDELSFIDFMLVNEISKNVDGYRISSFLYKERESEGGELVAGPLWDFNLAWGNADYCQGGDTTGWEIYFNSVCGGSGGLQNPFWWDRLLQDPEYAHAVSCRWQELRQGILHTDTLMNYIDSMTNYLDDAAARNYTKWPILGIYLWPNNFIGVTYQEEMDYLKSWTTGRLIWMDNNMFGTCADLGFDDSENAGNEFSVFPNPATNFTTITLNKIVVSGKIILRNSLGEIIKTEMLSNQDSTQLLMGNFTSGVYFVEVFENEISLGTKRIVLL